MLQSGLPAFTLWDYLPHIKDILESPQQKIWQWAGGGVRTQAILLLAIFVVAGPICFYCISCLTARLANRLNWLNSTRAPIAASLGMILVIFGVIPSLALFKDRSGLDRVYSTMALPFPIKQQLQRLSDYSAIQLETTHTASVAATFSVIGRSTFSKIRGAPVGHGT